MEQSPVRFAHDIRPRFRDTDVKRMVFKFDLSSHDDVRVAAEYVAYRHRVIAELDGRDARADLREGSCCGGCAERGCDMASAQSPRGWTRP